MDKLTGHATKNQDLLVASGAVSLRGTESAFAVEEDVQVVRVWLATTGWLAERYDGLADARPAQSAQLTHDPTLAARSKELTHLAQSIAGLADLFKDLGALVVEQGTILDSVEYNIEQTATHVKEAVTELKVATE